MFLIPTYLAPSRIQGIGVFAAGDIPKGQLIWRFDPAVDWEFTAEELGRMPEPFQSRLKIYCYLNHRGTYWLCGDNARYVNHSEESNCDDTGGAVTVARRDIKAGEELTSDYRLFDQNSAACGPGPLFS
jgi:hypothetical protein